jgi:hypothetical protein
MTKRQFPKIINKIKLLIVILAITAIIASSFAATSTARSYYYHWPRSTPTPTPTTTPQPTGTPTKTPTATPILSPTSTPNPSPAPTPPDGVVYWRTGFENGFNDINKGGETEIMASYSTISTVTNPVFKGNYACKTEVITPPPLSVSDSVYTKAVRWTPMRTLTEAYYGAALYLSPTFTVPNNGWTNIMQLHEMNGNGVYLYLGVERDSNGMHLTLRTQQPEGYYAELWRDSNLVTLGSWFTSVFYLQTKTNGAAALWINNQQVYSGTGNYAPTDGNQGPFFDTGLYQSYNTPTNYVISDEMICASTLTAATP